MSVSARRNALPASGLAAMLLIGSFCLFGAGAVLGAAAGSNSARIASSASAGNRVAAASQNAPPRTPQNQPLGSLRAAGDVFSGETRVPGELTVFSGDTIRVGEGMATFTASSGRGTIAIFPQSQIVFSGDPHFVAELKSGRAGVRSANGPNGVILRAGNFVIVASVVGQESDATVDRMEDGSFLIDCTEGSVGVVPLAGGSGLFIRQGQSVRITPSGTLVAVPNQAAANTTPPPALKRGTRTGLWILLGAGGGGAAIAAILAATHHAAPPITPVSP